VNAYYEANVGSEHSKSANAAQAEAEGRFPMTVAAKKLGINPGAFKSGCRAAKYESSEWHHTGSHARRTDYYDTNILAANADFWRGAAHEYSPKAAAKLLSKHGVNPLSDAELAAEKEREISASVARVEAFLALFDGPRFLVQKLEDRGADFAEKGYKAQTKWRSALSYNSAMDMLGVTTGYDSSSNLSKLHSTLEKAQEWLVAWQQRSAKSFPEKAPLVLRIVTLREDIMTECALYGRVGGKFQRLGEYSEYVVSKTPQGANLAASVNSSNESAPVACAAAQPTAEVECSEANGQSQENIIEVGFQPKFCTSCARSWDDCTCKVSANYFRA
jgi:hypothetical protein